MGQNNCTYKVALKKINEEKKQNNDVSSGFQARETLLLNPNPPLFSTEESSKLLCRDVCAGTSVSNINFEEEHPERRLEKSVHQEKCIESKNKKQRDKKLRKSRRSEKHNVSADESSETESIILPPIDVASTQQSRKTRKERKSLIDRFLDKIKEAMSTEGDFEKKIKVFMEFIWSEVKNYVQKYITIEMLLKLFGNHNNG